jgi:hypothetical protein
VCTATGRLEGAKFDHFFDRDKNRVTQMWLVCGECNRHLLDADYRAASPSAFESYQVGVKPLLSRQIPMALEAVPKGE